MFVLLFPKVITSISQPSRHMTLSALSYLSLFISNSHLPCFQHDCSHYLHLIQFACGMPLRLLLVIARYKICFVVFNSSNLLIHVITFSVLVLFLICPSISLVLFPRVFVLILLSIYLLYDAFT